MICQCCKKNLIKLETSKYRDQIHSPDELIEYFCADCNYTERIWRDGFVAREFIVGKFTITNSVYPNGRICCVIDNRIECDKSYEELAEWVSFNITEEKIQKLLLLI